MKYLNAIRYSEWWEYKLCPLLAIGYATLLIQGSPFLKNSRFFLFLLLAMAIGAAYVCFINDITDMKEDLACGKTNRMAAIPVKIRWVLPVACLLAGGLLSVYFLLHDIGSFFLYVMACVSFSLYSLEPFRLKRRGFWGIVADACGSHVFPSLLFVSAISHFLGKPVNGYWFAAVGIWALCYGLRGILWHQFRDRENDRKAGIHTFALTVDPVKFVIPTVIIFGFEMIALLIMLYIIAQPICLVALVVYAIVVFFRYRVLGLQIILIRTPPSNCFQILMMDYYQFFLPLSLLIGATMTDLSAGWILLIHILLFPQKVWCIFKDIFLSVRRVMIHWI